mgnify:CR=1 FL=1
MKKRKWMKWLLIPFAVISAGVAFPRPATAVAPTNAALDLVVGGIFTECDGDTPCNVGCWVNGSGSKFIYNNGAKTCGSPALANCSNGTPTTCYVKYHTYSGCNSPYGDGSYTANACSGGTIGPPPPLPSEQ